MSDVTVSISSTPDLVTNVTIIEDDFPVQVGYDDNDVIPGPTGPAGEDGEQGPAGPPGPGSIQNLSDVLTEGNDGGGAQIKNIGTPTANQDAATKNYVDSNISTTAIALQNADLTEANNRAAADAALQTQVSSLGITAGTHSTQILALQNADVAEASARADADTALLDLITTLDSWAKNNSGNIHSHLVAGEALAEGMVCFVDTDTLVYKANISAVGISSKVAGVCVRDTGTGEEMELYHSGFVQFTNPILVAGSLYYASTMGAISLSQSSVVVGYAITSQLMFVRIQNLDYNALQNKPTTFPPAAHSHAWAEITGKPSTFPPDAHGHDWAEITGKPTEFTPTAHSHDAADIGSGIFEPALLGDGAPDNTTVIYGDQQWKTPKAGELYLFEHFNHFVTAGQNAAIEAVLNSGSGAAVSSVQSSTPMGVLQQSTGTTATGSQLLRFVNNNGFMNKASTKILKFKVRIPTLSDGTNTFLWRGGFSNTIAASDGAQSVGFRYTHSENSGKFLCVSRQNNTESTTDSGVTVVANQWYEMEVHLNTTQAMLIIDGVAVAIMTTNLPTDGGSQYFGYVFQIVKSVGTTARTVQYDYYHVLIPTY